MGGRDALSKHMRTRVVSGDGNAPHSGGKRALDTRDGVLENKNVLGFDTQQRRTLKKPLGVRFAVLDVFDRDE